MTGNLVALVGISGVGKTTTLRAIGDRLNFQHLQASSLIREERLKAKEKGVSGDTLRLADIDENQRLLVSAVQRSIDPRADLVILDAHTVVDTPSGLSVIHPDVFRYLGVLQFIFLADDPSLIRLRRDGDASRQRPSRDSETLRQHQEVALVAAFSASLTLNVSLSVVTPSESDRMVDILRKALKASNS